MSDTLQVPTLTGPKAIYAKGTYYTLNCCVYFSSVFEQKVCVFPAPTVCSVRGTIIGHKQFRLRGRILRVCVRARFVLLCL